MSSPPPLLSQLQQIFSTNHETKRNSPSGDFIIDYHPSQQGLFLATGGSGHGYKFFPVLGDKIVDALEGKLEAELRALWTWPAAAASPSEFDGTEDGSRSGPKGLKLMDELARAKRGDSRL